MGTKLKLERGTDVLLLETGDALLLGVVNLPSSATFSHKSVGTELTQTEYEEADTHEVVPGRILPTIVRKSADEAVTNSTTLQNDDDLLLAVGANDVWSIYMVLLHYCDTVDSSDLDYAFTVPSGGSIEGLPMSGYTVPVDMTVEDELGTTTSRRYHHFFALYTGGGTAGNLQLQWAQNVATGAETKILANSFMICQQEE